MKRIVLVICILIQPLALFSSGGDGCATVGPDFLRMEPPARTAAMSGAFCGVADDSNAILFNPAGLAFQKHSSLSLTHFSSFIDTYYEYAAYATPLEVGNLGAAILFDTTAGFGAVNEFGDENGIIENYDLMLDASYAYKFTNSLSAGVNTKFFISKLDKYMKKGLAFDLGLMLNLGTYPDTNVGIVIQNMGWQEAYIEVPDIMPLNLKAGLGMMFCLSDFANLLVAADINRIMLQDEKATFDLGAEVQIYQMFFVRAGYGFKSSSEALSVGGGITFDNWFKVAYAFQPYDKIGSNHRISMDLLFEIPKKPNPAEETTAAVIDPPVPWKEAQEAPVKKAAPDSPVVIIQQYNEDVPEEMPKVETE